jgi:hypothetical protein
MTDEHEKRAAALAKDLFDKLSDFINNESDPWMSIDAKAEPARAALEKLLWGKALLGALAQQLGIVEVALIVGAHVPEDLVREVRDKWISSGHQACVEALETLETLEAQRADKETN